MLILHLGKYLSTSDRPFVVSFVIRQMVLADLPEKRIFGRVALLLSDGGFDKEGLLRTCGGIETSDRAT